MVPKGKRSRKRELVELGEKNQGNVQKELIIYNFSIVSYESYVSRSGYERRKNSAVSFTSKNRSSNR